MERIYRSFSGKAIDLSDEEYVCKKLILKLALGSELNVLANLLSRIALANRHTCDFTLNSLRSALSEVIACFPVYRTYVRGSEVSHEDRRYVDHAITEARRRSDAADTSVFDFIRKILLVDLEDGVTETYKKSVIRFAMKFQQVTAAVMAKGVEDTAFYRYNRLTSLNEVGGNPGKFGTSVDEFHRVNQQRLKNWPHSMLSSSTHDSKRSEDVRARINALSELPAEWRLRLRHWREWNRSKKQLIDGQLAPITDHEYLLYQTLLGAFPTGPIDGDARRTFIERIEQYLIKATREAKERTSWANPNEPYEHTLSCFIRALLEDTSENNFLIDFREFQERIARIGMFNSLSQTLLKLTSPGVPDTYQGTELFAFSLVDPDNRRPVDYAVREHSLHTLREANHHNAGIPEQVGKLVTNPQGDKLKQYVIWKTLTLRKKEPLLFQCGTYTPLIVKGECAKHIVAFARKYEQRQAVIAAPRLCATLLSKHDTLCETAVWGNTHIEIGDATGLCYHDIFTGHCLSPGSGSQAIRLLAGELFAAFPVALLLSESSAC